MQHLSREVCSTKLLATPIVSRGPGKVVQIDESLFNHKPKVISMFYSETSYILHYY